MNQDPPLRKDGRCANPGCGNRVPTCPPKTMPKGLRPMFHEALASEPFCSAVCCRAYHGIVSSSSYGSGAARKGYRDDRVRPAPAPRDAAAESRQRRAWLKVHRVLPRGHAVSAAQYRNGCRCGGCREEFRVWQRERRSRAAVLAAQPG